jgi:hypothetical protein
MSRRNGIIWLLFLVTVLAGCDQADVAEWAAPQIRVSFVDGQVAAAKSATVLQVELQILSQGGRDFSPEPVTVDNTSASQVAFDVTLPPDSAYSFTVRFTSAGKLVGEGATFQQVTLETTLVDINVLATSTTNPSIAFIPSQVSTSTGSGNIEITVRYYGGDQPKAGIAALLNITGPTPRPFTLEGADLNFVDGSSLNAAWQFSEDIQGVQDIGTLSVSRSQMANFCLAADENNVRVVDRSGNITSASLLGTCISVTP